MEIFYISLLTFIASIIGTFTGFGTSTIMIPVLIMFLPAVETMLLVGIIHWFGNFWKIIFFRKGFDKKLILLFGVVGIIFSYLGAHYSLLIDKELFLRILGGFFVLYAIYFIFEKSIKINANNYTALLGGSLSGFFAGLFGVGGAIRGMFLLSFNLPKEVYIATAGIIGLFVDSSRVITYYLEGTKLDENMYYALLLFIPISLLGAYIAKKFVNKISHEKFRIIVAVFLLLVGLKMIFFPL